MRRPLPPGLLIVVTVAVVAVAWRATGQHVSPGGITPPGSMGATRDDGGLRLALTLPPGPYFRDELLPVTVTLTNNTGKPVLYAGTLPPGPCHFDALNATLASNGQYVAPLSVNLIMRGCVRYVMRASTLPPGGSLQTRVPLGLPMAGQLTVMGQAFFPPTTLVTTGGPLSAGGPLDRLRPTLPALFRSTHAPFAGAWPSVAIDVSARVPEGRVLHIVRQGHTVLVRDYPRTLPSPVAQDAEAYTVSEGACLTGTRSWTPLSAMTLGDHGCEDESYSSERWQVLVGAPGYAIARAVYCYNPAPNMVFGGVPGSGRYSLAGCTEVIHT